MRDGSVTVVLYSDQPMLARGLASVLEEASGFRLEAVHHSLAETMESAAGREADILLLDYTSELTLPGLQDCRRSESRSKMVLWTYSISKELAFQAMELGVRGILRKSMQPEAFLSALRSIHDGELWFERGLLQSFFTSKRVVLTRREGQLVSLLAQGLKNKEIAASLLITEGTVKVYLSRLFKKLGVNDRFELALYGLKNLYGGFSGDQEPYGPAALERAQASLLTLHSMLMNPSVERCAANGAKAPEYAAYQNH
jgi:DNA-binding NarL/FixJ family response regulator